MENQEIFSFHLGRSLLNSVPENFPGLMHSERLFPMRLGSPVFNPLRYEISDLVLLARWENETALENFLEQTPIGKDLRNGWHIRLKFYRRWGFISELDNLPENTINPHPERPVVGITLARLRLSQTVRFLRWGKPVEGLVRDHPGKTFALAAMRPLKTLSTFSMWNSETEMIQMVKGNNVHGTAIGEQMRSSFHHEFTTMRFHPLKQFGNLEKFR